MNLMIETMFGYKISDVVGNNINMLMGEPHRTRALHGSYLASYLETGVKKVIGQGVEVVAQRFISIVVI